MNSSATTDEFIQLLTQHQPQLRGVIMAGLGNSADALDVLQRTNLAIWKKASEFDRTRSFLAWAIGVARFEVLAFIRDRRRDRHVFIPELAQQLMTEAEPEMGEVPVRQRVLRECMADLPAPSREVLVLRYVRQQSTQQISSITGRSLDGVKSLLLRVRRMLAGCIEKRLSVAAELQ